MLLWKTVDVERRTELCKMARTHLRSLNQREDVKTGIMISTGSLLLK